MEINAPIYWHQGMFLQPQHFQLDALARETALNDLVNAMAPDLWGLGELDIAAPALRNQCFEIRRARLRFARGSMLHYPGNALIAARRFDATWLETGKALPVYLGLHALSTEQANVTLCETPAAATQATTRLVAQLQPMELADLYSDGPSAQIRTLQYVLRVFFEPELEHLQGYELLPVARLVQGSDGPRLDDSFIPPCYAISGSQRLRHMLEDLREELTARMRQLEELKGERDSAGAESTPTLQFMLALRSLARATSWLTRACETGAARPADLYAGLRDLVAELSCFSTRCDALGATGSHSTGLAPFDPLRLRECFTQAHQVLTLLLHDIAVGPSYVLGMSPMHGCLGTAIPPQAFDRHNEFFLMLDASPATQTWAARVAHEARLVAPSDLQAVVTHALPGLALHHLGAVPSGLPRRARSAHWRIHPTQALWEAVQRDATVVLHWPQAPADLHASLIVLERQR